MGIFVEDPTGFVVPAVLVGLGAMVGAWLRWLTGLWLNPLFESPALGTLVVNLLGGFLMGAFLAWTTTQTNLSSAWRLLIATGLLGGLTTFSAFTAELLVLLQQGRLLLAAFTALLHTLGSLLFAFGGFYLVVFLLKDSVQTN